MRIQHNISALNAHRQLGNNNSFVSRNLEKLSSGYRINKAGDDAAGLAISEKMRAQIKGLDTAQKNAQDGISLVQTAEGALTEVHSMLNRMTELATQSANGTYDDAVDRKNLQKEIKSLKDEINRISEGTNYNGIKLLDGSLGGMKVTATDGAPAQGAVRGSFEIDIDTLVGAGGILDANKFSIGTGAVKIEVTGTTATDGDKAASLAAIAAEIGAGKDVEMDGDTYTVTMNGSKLSFTQKGDPTADKALSAANLAAGIKNRTTAAGAADITGIVDQVAPTVAATNGKIELDISKQPATGDTITLKAQDGTEKVYEFVKAGGTAKNAAATAIEIGVDADATATALATAIDADKAALGITGAANNNGKITLETDAANGIVADNTLPLEVTQQASGLVLQVGEDAQAYNRVSVKIGDMGTKALGIDGVDISNPEGASAALELIKNAINQVSSTRGDLGALQNRLDHTINNLGVASENMSAAESRIRDVDMAKEMMDFTKNNILTQASQAMLAQANQLPQGVLQLLQ